MALLMMDGFEHHGGVTSDYSTWYNANTPLPAKWSSIVSGWNNNAARTVQVNAGYSFTIELNGPTHYATMTCPSSTTLILGACYRMTSLTSASNSHLFVFSNATGNTPAQGMALVYNQDGSLGIRNLATSTTLYTSAVGVLTANVWQYIEVKIVFGASSTFEIRVDNAVITAQSGIDTRGGVTGGYTYVTLCSRATFSYVDDVYLCDGTGAAPLNDFLGPVSVYQLRPSGAGASTQMTASAGSNWQCVDDPYINTSGDHVIANAANLTDMYAVENLPVTPTTVFAVALNVSAKKNDNGNRTYRAKIQANSTTANGATMPLLYNTYRHSQELFSLQPNGSAWDTAAVNGMEIGIESQ